MPILADCEVLTMEVVGEFLRLDQNTTLFTHFRRYHTDLFPVLTRIPHDPEVSLVNTFPSRSVALPVPSAVAGSRGTPPSGTMPWPTGHSTVSAVTCAVCVPG